MSEKALVASGRFVKLFDGVDKWTDKETGEMRERPYTAAVVEYMGGRHVIREPYSPEEGAGKTAIQDSFKNVKEGDAVAVEVRLNQRVGRLELADLTGCVQKAA